MGEAAYRKAVGALTTSLSWHTEQQQQHFAERCPRQVSQTRCTPWVPCKRMAQRQVTLALLAQAAATTTRSKAFDMVLSRLLVQAAPVPNMLKRRSASGRGPSLENLPGPCLGSKIASTRAILQRRLGGLRALRWFSWTSRGHHFLGQCELGNSCVIQWRRQRRSLLHHGCARCSTLCTSGAWRCQVGPKLWSAGGAQSRTPLGQAPFLHSSFSTWT